VDIVVFTNKVDQLTAFQSSIMPGTDFIIKTATSEDPFMLTWEHRHFINDTIEDGALSNLPCAYKYPFSYIGK